MNGTLELPCGGEGKSRHSLSQGITSLVRQTNLAFVVGSKTETSQLQRCFEAYLSLKIVLPKRSNKDNCKFYNIRKVVFQGTFRLLELNFQSVPRFWSTGLK